MRSDARPSIVDGQGAGLSEAVLYTDFDALLADPRVDAVSICSPPNCHPEETIKAAKAGKHLLIEKAVANDPASLQAMTQAVQAAGIKTVVSFVLHWNPQFQWIKRMLQEKAIGDLFYAEVDYWHNIGPQYGQYRWNVKKDIAGSVWLSAGCHAVDAMREIIGRTQVSPQISHRKVLVVYEADRMNASTANVFLKTLEEPTPSTTILLLTTRPYALLPTIRSRCLHFRFTDAGHAALADAAPETRALWDATRTDYATWAARTRRLGGHYWQPRRAWRMAAAHSVTTSR